MIRRLPHITINNQDPKWIWHRFARWPQGAIHHFNPFAGFYFHSVPNSGRNPATAGHLYGKLKAASQTRIIASDTSLTISSLFTHSHYFCLVEQHSGSSRAWRRYGAISLRGSTFCRPQSQYDSVLPPQPGLPITLLKYETVALQRADTGPFRLTAGPVFS